MKEKCVSGGCQCGALRYKVVGPLGSTDLCHCRMCQKAFGSFGAVLTRVPFANFKWTRGKPATFQSSAHVARGFCASCGTPMFMFEDGDDFIDLATGTLDDPGIVKSLSHQIGIESKVIWFEQLHSLPHQTTAETRNPGDLPRLASFQHPDHDTAHWPPAKT
ncbi:MAG: GFA family protein [Alphaproteobacteria bacterium]|nr:GFA family protein [Alphaproteobacteria bacterium]